MTPVDIRTRARRRWDDGSVLSAYAAGLPAPALDLPVRGPSAREIGAQLAQARSWREALLAGSHQGACYEVIERTVGGRVIGTMTLPDRVRVTAYDQWWRLLHVAGSVERLDAVLDRTRTTHPHLVDWVVRRPLMALGLSAEWERLLAAFDWLVSAAGQGRYLREIAAPGVDTKFVEALTKVLGEWLDTTVDTDLRYAASRRFARRYGFAEATALVRLRVGPGLGVLPPGVTEVGLAVEELGGLPLSFADVTIVENQATYLSLPLPDSGIVIWGHGFDAGRLGRVPWLGDAARVRYWGDLDTHGFAILNLLRTQLPAVESVLMDRETLLAHRDRWVAEPTPTRADLTALTKAERALYEDLVEHVHGPSVRLEQERIAWPWALTHL